MKSFTLVELLVVIGIFSLVMGSISGIFISGIFAQRKILTTQQILDQASYALEYMGRTLRMAQKDIDGACIPQKTNYLLLPSKIKFKNYKGECQEFFLFQNQIMETRQTQTLPLVSLKVESLNFHVIGETQEDSLQPRVTISFKISLKGSQLNFQTTLSQRNLDVRY